MGPRVTHTLMFEDFIGKSDTPVDLKCQYPSKSVDKVSINTIVFTSMCLLKLFI